MWPLFFEFSACESSSLPLSLHPLPCPSLLQHTFSMVSAFLIYSSLQEFCGIFLLPSLTRGFSLLPGGNENHADLKSALKKEPGSHKHVHSVSWADQSVSLSITDTSDPATLQTELPETSIDIAKAARFASAEAIAAALTEAATAAAAGELDGSEAGK